ncbi:ABC transporter ATP-binding protein [Leifsonia virtsii]|uniref:ABC transporter ATP-binding protein n=1 Tax=Leifsonia virtsii TaxID=3035915 RepID=A0ABT8J1K7_9MICO|nr:ABC transporter ATP-binding protein [Leifsonia virtsii]MDN4598971.1 ABC transporter ATP-binding protein [Leifsonia virtsii]
MTTTETAPLAGSPADGDVPILEALHVTKHFPARGSLFKRGPRRVVHAADDVSIALRAGRIMALVGESGSGKSTFARLLAQLHPVTSGEIRYRGKPVRVKGGRSLRAHVSKVQLILQDPFGSFNPVATIARTLMRAVRIHHPKATAAEQRRIIDDLLGQVSLRPARQFTEKYPHELSGGQLQRISIARALAANPDVFLADEPVSSLDVSIRLGVLNLLRRLVEERGVALLYVTHDIASARYFAEDTSVMYAGQLVEAGPSETVTQNAAHPYTQLLIASAPDPSRADDARPRDIGQPPSLIDPPSGCRFHPRCPFAMERCRTDAPPAFALEDGQWAKCWLYDGDDEAAARRVENAAAYGLGAVRPAGRRLPTDAPATTDTKGDQQ